MVRYGWGSGDRYGVWMRGVGLNATIREAHRAARSHQCPVTGWFRQVIWQWTRPETVLLRRKAKPCPIDGSR